MPRCWFRAEEARKCSGAAPACGGLCKWMKMAMQILIQHRHLPQGGIGLELRGNTWGSLWMEKVQGTPAQNALFVNSQVTSCSAGTWGAYLPILMCFLTKREKYRRRRGRNQCQGRSAVLAHRPQGWHSIHRPPPARSRSERSQVSAALTASNQRFVITLCWNNARLGIFVTVQPSGVGES